MTTSNDSLGGRLAMAIASSRFTQTQIAAELGVSRQALSAIVKGRAPGLKHLAVLAQLLGISELWLREGGPTPPNIMSAPQLTSNWDNLNDQERVFMTHLADALSELRAIKSKDRDKYLAIQSGLPFSIRRFVASVNGPPGPVHATAEDLLALCAAVGKKIEGAEAVAFRFGYTSIREKRMPHPKPAAVHATDQGAGQALPVEAFRIVRASLLATIAQQRSMKHSAGSTIDTLEMMWVRQMSKQWPAATRELLAAMRKEDRALFRDFQ